MSGEEFLAQQRTKTATKMIRIASLLAKEELTQGDMNEIETAMKSIRYYAEGKPKGMESEISDLAQTVALRAAKIGSSNLPVGEITAFGNGAHTVLPKEYIGRKIMYQIIDWGTK